MFVVVPDLSAGMRSVAHFGTRSMHRAPIAVRRGTHASCGSPNHSERLRQGHGRKQTHAHGKAVRLLLPAKTGLTPLGRLVIRLNGRKQAGGEGGIRTHGTVPRTLAFEASTFNHSVTSPRWLPPNRSRAPGVPAMCCRLAYDAPPKGSPARKLAACRKERLQQCRRFSGQDARGEFHVMIQLRMR